MSNYLDDLAEDGFGYWLAGFLDGEGSFLINSARQRFQPVLRVKLRDDDAAILFQCQTRTGLGRVFPEKAYVRADARNTRPQMVWQITTKADLPKLIEVLDRFPLRAKKRVDFDLWKLAAMAWVVRPRDGDWGTIEAVRDQLMASRQYQVEDLVPTEWEFDGR